MSDVDSLLDSFGRFGVDLGLDRILQLLDDLGNPQARVPIIHVAGTNGKGSVCAYLSSILSTAGYRVGRYISPHLVSWCDRFCINNQAIAPAELYDLLHRVCQAIRPDSPSPTQFEVVTAAAFLYFAEQQVDVAVMEVGLGGRLDATNVCDRPLVSVITSISREHWQRLGSTLGAIAGEKAGILKSGCPAVIGQLPPEAEAVVRQRAADVGCQPIWVKPSIDVGEGKAQYSAQTSESPSLVYPLPLPGQHQLMNSALAIAAVQVLRTQGWTIGDRAIIDGMQKTRWAGRIQWSTWKQQPLLIDGAHNPAAATVLRQYVDQKLSQRLSQKLSQPKTSSASQSVHWVMGMLSTKDHADIFEALLRDGDRLSLVPVPDHSSASPADLAQLVTELEISLGISLGGCTCFTEIEQALDEAFRPTQTQDSSEQPKLPATTPSHLDSNDTPMVVLCGSLYLIGHVFQQHPELYS
ncbi:MAG: folylpolyglutamate synthase/dihydrofolate synthase family protein [Elainellaceae cyanobacterium]